MPPPDPFADVAEDPLVAADPFAAVAEDPVAAAMRKPDPFAAVAEDPGVAADKGIHTPGSDENNFHDTLTPAQKSAEERDRQYRAGKTFKNGEPFSPFGTEARTPVSRPVPEEMQHGRLATYAHALGQGAGRAATALGRTINQGYDAFRYDIGLPKSGNVEQLDYQDERMRQAALEKGYDAEMPGVNVGGVPILPGAQTVEGIPQLATAFIPGVGPEVMATSAAAEAKHQAELEGAPQGEQWQRALGAGAGTELGFRVVPGLKPEFGKLSPTLAEGPSTLAGGPPVVSAPSITGRLAEGALMGEAQDLTTPTEDGKPHTLEAGAEMAALALLGGRVQPKRAPLEGYLRDKPQPDVIDPSAETQVDLTPYTEPAETIPEIGGHGPINTEPMRGPANVDTSESDAELHNLNLDRGIERRKAVAAARRADPTETDVMPPVTDEQPSTVIPERFLERAPDTQDRLNTASIQDQLPTERSLAQDSIPTEPVAPIVDEHAAVPAPEPAPPAEAPAAPASEILAKPAAPAEAPAPTPAASATPDPVAPKIDALHQRFDRLEAKLEEAFKPKEGDSSPPSKLAEPVRMPRPDLNAPAGEPIAAKGEGRGPVEMDRGGKLHALQDMTAEGRTLERQNRLDSENLHQKQKDADVEFRAREALDNNKKAGSDVIEKRFRQLESYGVGEHELAREHLNRERAEALRTGDVEHLKSIKRLQAKHEAIRSRGAAELRMGRDRVATPKERLDTARSHAFEPSQAHAARLDELRKEVDDLKAKVAAAKPAEPKKPFTPNQRRSANSRKKAALNDEFKTLAKKMGDTLIGKGPAASTGGPVFELAYKMLENRVKHGALAFEDAVLAITDHVLAARHDPDVHKTLEEAWDKLAESNSELTRDGSAADAIESDPRQSLEARIERTQKHYDALEKSLADRHAQLEAMTPEKRQLFFEGEAAESTPPALQKLKTEGNERLKVLRDKLKAFEAKDEEAPPTLLQQIREEQRRLDEMEGRMLAKRDRLAQLSPEQRLEEARARRPDPAIAEVRQQGRAELADLRKELQRLQNPDQAYGPGATDLQDPRVVQWEKALKRSEKQLLKLEKKDADRAARVFAGLKARGFDIEDPHAPWLDDPRQMGPFLSALAAARGDLWDTVYEFRRNMVHWSLQLVAGHKPLSDAISSATYWGFKRPMEAILNALPGGDPAGAQLRELPHAISGILPGLVRGWQNALYTFKYERSGFDDQFREALTEEHFYPGGRITGPLGRAVRMSMTAVSAIDAFVKSANASMDVAAQAYRRAHAQGLKGDKLKEFMASELDDLESESWKAAVETAKKRTFTEDSGEIVNKINQIKQMEPKTAVQRAAKEVVRHTFLFTSVPTNIIKQGLLENTPILNTLDMIRRMGRSMYSSRFGDGKWTYTRNEFNTDAANQIFSTVVGLSVYGLMNSKDGLGNARITGYDDKKNRASILIGGHYYSYAKAGPIAHAIGTVVDAVHALHAMKAGDPVGSAWAALGSAVHQIKEESLLRGVADLVDGISDTNHFTRFAANFTTSFVPTVLKHAIKASHDDEAENRVRDGGGLQQYGQSVKNNLGFAPPRVDVWGNTIQKDRFANPATTWLWRVMSPAQLGDKMTDKTKLDYLVTRWNEEHPLGQIEFTPPTRVVTEGQPYSDGEGGVLGGRKTVLTQPQMEKVLRAGGEEAKKRLLERFGKLDVLVTPQQAQIVRRIWRGFISSAKRKIAHNQPLVWDSTDEPSE